MKKNEVKEKNDDVELSKKIIDLCLWYQIEDSQRWIDIIGNKIKFCDLRIKHLLDSKPIFFQVNKIKKFNSEIEELEKEKTELYKQINEEVEMIEKLNKSINKNIKDSHDKGEISYYELLGMIKSNINPNKVLLKVLNEERVYIFKNNNYILINKDEENKKFDLILGNSLSDKDKLERNIIIL